MPVCCALPSFLPSEVTDVWMDYGLGCAFWVLGFGFWVLVTAVGWGGWLGWLVGSPITAEKQAVTSKSHNRQVGVLGALSVSWTTTSPHRRREELGWFGWWLRRSTEYRKRIQFVLRPKSAALGG